MAQQTINNGESGATVRGKLNANFAELYTGKDAVTVANFAALPTASTVTGQRYWALAAQGVYLVNRKPAGAYYSDGTTWTWLGDNPSTAAQLGFVPAQGIAATDVQAAIEEAVTDQASVNATLVPQTRSVATTAPLQGGGALSATLNLSISASSGSATGSMSSADFTKLAGIASAATANSPDATLLARANHTGTQAVGTITGNWPVSQLNGGTGASSSTFWRGDGVWATPAGGGTVTSVSVTTANGVSGSVATATSTPAITLTLGAITPSSVNGVTLSGSSTPTLAVTGTTTVSGANTGDQTSVTGNAGTATTLQTGRTLAITGDLAWTSPSFNGSGNVTAAGTLATVNSNVGSFGSATAAPTFTVNGKGLLTAAGTVTITPAWSSITSKPTTLSGYGITDAEQLGKQVGRNAQTGTTYTLVLTDAGKLVEMNNASANTLTVPPNSSVAFPIDTRIDLSSWGAGQTTIAQGAGVTIRSEDGKLKLTKQYSGGSLYKRATDEWWLTGSLAA